MSDKDPLKNARKKVLDTYNNMSPEQQKRVLSRLKDLAAEDKEQVYAVKNLVANCLLIFIGILMCLALLAIMVYLGAN